MKKLLATFATSVATVLAVSTATLLPVDSWARPVLTITPAIKAVAVGETFVMSVGITGLAAEGEIVSAFDLNVLFNSSLLGSIGVGFFNTPFGGNANVDTSITSSAGNIGAILNSFSSDAELAALQTGNPLNLFTLTFTALAVGDTFLNFGPDANFDRLVVGRNGLPLALDYVGACVSVGASAPGTGCQNTVPEPTSFALIGLALLAGGLAGRKGLRAVSARG